MNKELDIGNIEYKRYINFTTHRRQESLISQLKFRLKEGNGFCIYYIGLEDDGKIYPIDNECYEKSIENLKYMCNQVNAKIISIINKDNNNYYEVQICDVIPLNEYRILNICNSYSLKYDDKNTIDFVGIDNDNNILKNDEYSIYDIKKNSNTLLYVINCNHYTWEIIQYILTFKPHLINFESIEFDENKYLQYKSYDDFIKTNEKLYQLFNSMGYSYTFENNIIKNFNNFKDKLFHSFFSKNIMNIFDVLFNGKLLNDSKIYACITNNKVLCKDSIYIHLDNISHKLDIIDIQHISQSSVSVESDKLISISTKFKIKNDYHICSNKICECMTKNDLKIEYDKNSYNISNIDFNKIYRGYYKNQTIGIQFYDEYIKLNKKVILDEKYLIIDLIDQFILINIY
jgi:hypothetical protein